MRPSRERKKPAILEMKESLREKGTGNRYEKVSRLPECDRPECQALSAEHRWLQQSLATIKNCYNELQRITCDMARGDAISEQAIMALQCSLLEVLEGAELTVKEIGGVNSEAGSSNEHATDDAQSSCDDMIRLPSTWRVGVGDQVLVGELMALLTSCELVWEVTNGGVPAQRFQLSPETTVSAQLLRLSPFKQVSRVIVNDAREASPISFDCNASQFDAAAEFAEQLQQAVAVSRAAQTRNVGSHSSTAGGRTTGRVQLGRELRGQLLEAMRLRNRHKAREADAMLKALEDETREAAERAQKSGLMRKRATQLREEAFSYGGLQLTRDIVTHFLNMPEVKELLRNHRDSPTSGTNELIVNAAKDFLATIFKPNGRAPGTGGRLNDEARNAHVAALATLLPRDLFESRKGRAACRALGISYRQAKRGTETRAELMDSATGWKRIKTAERAQLEPRTNIWHS